MQGKERRKRKKAREYTIVDEWILDQLDTWMDEKGGKIDKNDRGQTVRRGGARGTNE